jgi:TolB-like protein
MLVLFCHSNSGADEKETKPEGLGTLAVLDLVDLSSNRTLSTLSHKLRLRLAKVKRWKVLEGKEQRKILKKYNKDPNKACNDTQCGFELGSLMQTNYVLFGSATRLKSLGILTLKLLNIQKAKVVWSKVMISNADRIEMENTLYTVKHELALATVDTLKKSENLLAILDLSPESPESQLLFECVLTHAYNLKIYDIMSPTEVKELVSVLDIDPEALMKDVYQMGEIGKTLDVKAVLISQLDTKGINYKHSMTMYDVIEKSVVLSMPAMSQASFRDLVLMEQNFFTGLARIKGVNKQPKEKIQSPNRSKIRR